MVGNRCDASSARALATRHMNCCYLHMTWLLEPADSGWRRPHAGRRLGSSSQESLDLNIAQTHNRVKEVKEVKVSLSGRASGETALKHWTDWSPLAKAASPERRCSFAQVRKKDAS